MDPGEIESVAEQLYSEAGLNPRQRTTPLTLATRLLGAGSVRSVHAHGLPGEAALARVGGAFRIYVRRGLERRRRGFVICHELAEWHLLRVGCVTPEIEEIADAIGAALLAPRQLFLQAVREDGRRFHLLARRFDASESWAALRLGEATCDPLALVAPQRVRVRGPEAFVWPDEGELRRIANQRRTGPGIIKVRLRDDARRAVLLPTRDAVETPTGSAGQSWNQPFSAPRR